MKSRSLRIIIPLAVLAVAGVCFAVGAEAGTLSAFGWQDIAIICPIGALFTMASSHSVLPHAIVSLALFVLVAIVAGRVVCGWVCPVPVVRRIPGLFSRKAPVDSGKKVLESGAPLSDAEMKVIHDAMGGCAAKHGSIDSRHIILGGGLLSALIFGFPVFCLICPIGLSFATIFLVIRAFGFGDVSWTLVIVPALLILEVLVFRKWCHKICPIAALTSLVAKGNRTFQPVIDSDKCLESHGKTCSRCHVACSEGIHPRHPEIGSGMSECTRCMACVDACPSGAISIRPTKGRLPKKEK